MSPRLALPCLVLALPLAWGLGSPTAALAAKPGIGFTDLMQVSKVFAPVVSDDGRWIAFEARPDRGDGEVVVRSTRGSAVRQIARGRDPRISVDGAWVAAQQLAPFADREQAEEDAAPEPGAVLLRTSDGRAWTYERVKAHGFSEDGAWFAVHFVAPEQTDADSTAAPLPEPTSTTETRETRETPEIPATRETPEIPATPETPEVDEPAEPRVPGTRLLLIRLADQRDFVFEDVASWAFAPTVARIALAIATETGVENRLELRALDRELEATTLASGEQAAFPHLQWAEEHATLAFLQGDEAEPGTVTDLALHVVALDAEGAVGPMQSHAPEEGWEFPAKNELRFSRDGARLFAGLRPTEPEQPEVDADAEFDPLDPATILADRGVDVWHWQDPRIKTHEKASYEERQKHLYRAVVEVAAASLLRLADEEVPDVAFVQNERAALGLTQVRWLPLETWDGSYRDAHLIDLRNGARTLVVVKTKDEVELSPRGGFVAYYRPDGNGQWWLYDAAADAHRRLEAPTIFADEDHDYPSTPPSYGVAGWTTDDRTLFVYDKYDVWSFDTATGAARCVTDGRGRADRRTYRILDLDPEQEGITPATNLLLSGFDERRKTSSFWSVAVDASRLREVRAADKRFALIAKAKDADLILYTEERYHEFPDLWVADTSMRGARKLTDVNPQLRNFDFGRAELVEWTSADGIPLQGVLIKPAGYAPGRRYPVLVYFYRFFSQRLHEFNDPVVNHRPSFPVYAGDGYAVFLPDIRFEIGEPGSSATRCLVPGVQKLIDMGVADPEAIALHGHSWSGYQTAHVITQTDLFACAVAGAPVSNMVSAYGGIRYGTGHARLFQYEKEQSRIGASLWERRDLYIDNSPIFFADRIATPLLIQFGDVDEAVPWTQGIELYLAMRRLGKPCVMLQYRDEPHHLKRYANKLDYSLRMKEFIDHFCKGAPAPQWWATGEPYAGE